MAGSPDWKVYRDREYVGCTKYAEDAAVLVACSGGEVRWGHSKGLTVWREGKEKFTAGESYDSAAKIMRERKEKLNEQAHAKMETKQKACQESIRKMNENAPIVEIQPRAYS